MADLLYRLGRFAARRRWTVVGAWVVILVLAAGGYLLGGGTLASSVSIPGTPTALTTEKLQKELPGASGGTASAVFHTEDGSPFTAAQQKAITALLADVAKNDGLESVVNPFTSEAARAAQSDTITEGRAKIAAARTQLEQGQAQLDAATAQATSAGVLDQAQAAFDAQQTKIDTATTELESQSAKLETGASLLKLAENARVVSKDNSAAVATLLFTEPQLDVQPEVKDAIRATFESASIAGVDIDLSNELVSGIPSLGGASEIIGVVIAGVVLLIMLGTLITAGLPLIAALVGVGVGALTTLSFSGLIEMSSVTPALGLMLGLAVGIDYSLFIINRYRQNLRHGMTRDEAIGLANGTSGNAVVFAGATVVIALLALNITGIPFLGLMGTAGALCVAVAVLIAVTLTPALLSIVGRKVMSKKAWARIEQPVAPAKPVKPVRPMSTTRAVLTTIGAIVVLLAVAIPSLSMRLGLPDGSSEATNSTQYRAYKVVADKFGAGQNGALVVVADLPAGLSDQAVLEQQVSIGEKISALDSVVAVAPIGSSDNNRVTAFQVIPVDGPTSESTETLVTELRSMSPLSGDIPIEVAGQTTGNIDISEKLASALPLYLAIVIGLSLLILIVVFRSILVPIIATAGFALSLFAALGGLTAVYQFGWFSGVTGVHDPGPVLNFLPTIMVGLLFGLAMDYQLFLASGMREAWVHGAPARTAVQAGMRAGRAVVIAAAIIMISVFGGFMFSEVTLIRPFGFALAFGVLVDAFVVRILLMPAVMHLLGEKAWWIPKWLDRIMPDADVEGASLERKHHAPSSIDVDPTAVEAR
ncbi:MMPL family transporter [Glaciihabitans sp. dw_435]|uniref:MMPL family transporter n=1 Tax=Glaciihabitans sp. dw_435 TaxID=2720081 RepID=UPI001BD5F4A3|nr:MMPL family transporter [Glaciihabitans sp. dw_435]